MFKSKKGWNVSAIIFIPLFGACISAIDHNPSLEEGLVVVEGFITDDFGPHEINITRLAPFTGPMEGASITQVDGANIYLFDDLGVMTPIVRKVDTVTELTDVQTPMGIVQQFVDFPVKTNYITPANFKGEVGRTYTLTVELPNLSNYVSSPQTMPSGAELDSIFLRFVKLPSADPVTFSSGLEIYSQFQDPPDEDNYYLWSANRGTYLQLTRPDLYLDPQFGTPAPKDCCHQCFISDPIKQVIVQSDFGLDGEVITVSSAFIQDDGMRFNDRYHLEIRMFSISQEAFIFHEQVSTQLEIDGDIFDPPPSLLAGNISNRSNPEETVIGFFGAYNASSKSIFIVPSDLEEHQLKKIIHDDCRTVVGATTEIPEFWDN